MSNTVKTILVLATNPISQTKLRLDEEVREIDEGLRRSRHRESFRLEQKWAVDTDSLRRALLDFEPQIVHFCGHGSGDEGLILEDKIGQVKLVTTEALATLFELCKEHVECVVLNACYSERQANAIVQYIGYVVGMSEAIGDKAAVKFAVGFYDALGAGRSVEAAHKFGCSAIQMESIPEYLIPILKKNTNAVNNYLKTASAKSSTKLSKGRIDFINLVAFTHGAYSIWIIGNLLIFMLLILSRTPLYFYDVLMFLSTLFLGVVLPISTILVLRRKCRMFSVMVGLYLVFLFPLGTLIGGLTLYSLFRQQTIEEYQ